MAFGSMVSSNANAMPAAGSSGGAAPADTDRRAAPRTKVPGRKRRPLPDRPLEAVPATIVCPFQQKAMPPGDRAAHGYGGRSPTARVCRDAAR
ncbi:MAG: hypothetical protein JXR77_02850, partial [Lentisphaeria bacterium]|nr:hypothetical protein [Lentisphaeria bacterium]